jgi:hypothetical protein
MNNSIGLAVAAVAASIMLNPLASANAEEVFYCIEKSSHGFVWGNQKGNAVSMSMTAGRHLVRVVSETERLITRTTNDKDQKSTRYTCKKNNETTIACDEGGGIKPWIFYDRQFVRAILAKPPLKGESRDILIAYGTCTKF